MMTSREFLNVAHAALIEEFQRPRLVQGVMVPGLALSDALKAAAPWAEGYVDDVEEEEGFSALRKEMEAEAAEADEEAATVAKNEAALRQLEAQMGGVLGGFFKAS